jgi:KDO2-lipid IV(A) lauroyltransferase
MAEQPPWLRWLDDRKDRALHAGLRALPTPATSAMGAGIAALALRLRHARKVEGAMAALEVLRPEIPAPCRRDMALRNLTAQARTLAEYGRLDRLWAEGRISVEGQENLRGARPPLVAALHLGNWETIGPAMRGLGHAVSAIYQPPRSAAQHAIVVRAREAYGVSLIAPGPAGARKALRVLQGQHEALLVYVDEYQNGRVNAPALGRPPATGGNLPFVLRLAARTGAPLVPAYALRESGARFRVHFLPALPVTGDLATDQAALEAVIEPLVRRHLDQWLMLYPFRADR